MGLSQPGAVFNVFDSNGSLLGRGQQQLYASASAIISSAGVPLAFSYGGKWYGVGVAGAVTVSQAS